jgi:hypothetical protein
MQSEKSDTGSKREIRWAHFLNPDVLRPTITMASIYIAAFEILKDALINRVREFYLFIHQYSEDDPSVDAKYGSDVLSLNKSVLYASLNWLTSMQAIDQKDIDAFERIKSCRNVIAHELHRIVSTGELPPDFIDCFKEMIRLLQKIETWWVLNFEIPANPDFDGQEIDQKSIISGPILWLQWMSEVAFGSTKYYDDLKSNSGNTISD